MDIKEVEKESPEEERTELGEGEERKVDEAEKALAIRLLKQITTRVDSESFKTFIKNAKRNRTYAAGEQEQDGEKGLVRANLILPELKKAQNECYAKNPEISIAPTETVAKDRYETWKGVGKTLELVLQNQFAPGRAKLKAKAKRAVRSADTTGFGWLKVVYQKHIEQDPIVMARMDDIQDNIQRIDRLMKDLRENENTEGLGEQDAKREELQQQLDVLEEKKEIVRAQGLSFTVRPTENVIFSDDVVDCDDLGDAGWITDEIFMTVERFKDRFKFCPKTADRYNSYQSKTKESPVVAGKGDEQDTDDQLVRVFEMWRKADKRIYTMVEGYEGFIRPPYTPRKLGERFHGFFPLYFDPVDGSPFPVPLVSQLIELQDEHNTARTNFREHREKSVPFNVAHGGVIDPTDIEKMTNPGFMETVVLKSAPENMPLDQIFKSVQHPAIDPSVYSTEHVARDWEQITRRGDAARGTVGKAKTATEADILQSNLAVDTSERRDVVEDWFREVAQYCAELVLQEMTIEEVRRIAGEEAPWPEMAKSQVFDLVELTVRVGSSGKPNASMELEKWIKMLPQFRESLLAIVHMRAEGKDKEAEILTKLLRETIERFEERIDLDSLLPEQDEEEQDPAKEAAIQQQQQQMALQMKEMLSKIANVDADTMLKIAEAEAKEAGPQMQIYMTVLQGLLNKQQQPGASNAQIQ